MSGVAVVVPLADPMCRKTYCCKTYCCSKTY